MTLAADAENLMGVLGQEDGIYLPRTGGSRSIDVIVNRHPPEALRAAPHGHSPIEDVWVLNDAAKGISSAEVDKGGDILRLADCVGSATTRDYRITAILSQDSAMMQLEVK